MATAPDQQWLIDFTSLCTGLSILFLFVLIWGLTRKQLLVVLWLLLIVRVGKSIIYVLLCVVMFVLLSLTFVHILFAHILFAPLLDCATLWLFLFILLLGKSIIYVHLYVVIGYIVVFCSFSIFAKISSTTEIGMAMQSTTTTWWRRRRWMLMKD